MRYLDIEYLNNIEVGTATINVIGMGDYTGTATTTFEISPADISLSSMTNDHWFS